MGNWMKLADLESGCTLEKKENKEFDMFIY